MLGRTMFDDSLRKCFATGAALLMAAAIPSAANAVLVDYTFTTSGGNNSLVSSKVFTSNTAAGTAVKVNVSAWHWNNGDTTITDNAKKNSIASASLGLWSPGLGVIAAGESASTNEHQIDNIGGVDFIMLQFDRMVSLSNIGRVVYDLGFNPDDSDAAYWADTAKLLGTPATYLTAPNLTAFSFSSSVWTTIAGNGLAQPSTPVTGSPWASVWLIGAEPKDAISVRNDGFKLSSLVVTADVPEPATWGMMVLGFGLVGSAIRRSRKFGLAAQA